jgi:hypothetical protein
MIRAGMRAGLRCAAGLAAAECATMTTMRHCLVALPLSLLSLLACAQPAAPP